MALFCSQSLVNVAAGRQSGNRTGRIARKNHADAVHSFLRHPMPIERPLVKEVDKPISARAGRLDGRTGFLRKGRLARNASRTFLNGWSQPEYSRIPSYLPILGNMRKSQGILSAQPSA